QDLAVARLVRLAHQIIDDEGDATAQSSRTSRRRPGSLRDLQARLHLPESEIRQAELTAAIIDHYPELRRLPRWRLRRTADDLDELPPDQRQPWLQRIAAGDASDQDILGQLRRD